MLELREQNARLHRRVRDLEHLNNLEKMHKELNVRDACPELDKDTAFAETILESILSETKMPKKRKFSKRGRGRSGSVTVPGVEPEASRRASTCVDSRAKVSKWTKVKAAFKWEKAAPNVSDAKSQDSGIGGIVPVEVARYLRVPSCDEHGHSPVDSGAAEISTPGSLSTASSAEDFHRHGKKNSNNYYFLLIVYQVDFRQKSFINVVINRYIFEIRLLMKILMNDFILINDFKILKKHFYGQQKIVIS